MRRNDSGGEEGDSTGLTVEQQVKDITHSPPSSQDEAMSETQNIQVGSQDQTIIASQASVSESLEKEDEVDEVDDGKTK